MRVLVRLVGAIRKSRSEAIIEIFDFELDFEPLVWSLRFRRIKRIIYSAIVALSQLPPHNSLDPVCSRLQPKPRERGYCNIVG